MDVTYVLALWTSDNILIEAFMFRHPTTNDTVLVVVVVGCLPTESCDISLIWHFIFHPHFLFLLMLKLSLLFFLLLLFFLILLLILFFDRLLFVSVLLFFFILVLIFFFPLHQDSLLIPSLENGTTWLQFKVCPIFYNPTSSMNLREVHLCLIRIMIHRISLLHFNRVTTLWVVESC